MPAGIVPAPVNPVVLDVRNFPLITTEPVPFVIEEVPTSIVPFTVNTVEAVKLLLMLEPEILTELSVGTVTLLDKINGDVKTISKALPPKIAVPPVTPTSIG